MSLTKSLGIGSMFYVPAVVVASWALVWWCRTGLRERPPIGLLLTLPLATAEVVIIGPCLAIVALVVALGWKPADAQWPSIATVLLLAKYNGLAVTAVLLGLLLRACRSGRTLALLTYLELGVSGLLRHSEMRQVGQTLALGEDFPSTHVDWVAFLIVLAVGTLFIVFSSRLPNGKLAS